MVYLSHFHELMKKMSENVDLALLPELNSAWAVVLIKGHGKPCSSHCSYRCISTCPLLSKGMDSWIGSLRRRHWNKVKSKNQYMTEGSSHDLASLMLTEAIQYSLCHLKQPLWVLFMDKMSVFDSSLKRA